LQLSYSLSRLGIDHAVLSDDPAPGGMFRRWPIFQRMLSWTKPSRLAAAAAAHQLTTGTGLGGLLSSEEGRNGREGLSEAAAEAAWAEGQSMNLEQAVAYALGGRVTEAPTTHG
jgi:hypothetical protein